MNLLELYQRFSPLRLEGESELEFSQKHIATLAYFAGAGFILTLGLFAYFNGFYISAVVEAVFFTIFLSMGFWIYNKGTFYPQSVWIMAFTVTFMPCLTTMFMGGFIASGGRSIWSFMAVIGALVLWNDKRVLMVLIAFLVAFSCSVFFHPHIESIYPDGVHKLLLIINLAGVCVFAFWCFYMLYLKLNTLHEVQKQSNLNRAMAETKSQFMSVMSHEIRTPLNSIIGMCDILLDEKPRDDQLDNLKVLNFSSKSLLHLVNDILDFSKMEAGKVQLDPQVFSLNDFMKSTYQAFLPQSRENNVRFNIEYPQVENIYLFSDASRLGQILNNLLSNAIKFSPNASVTLIVDVDPAGSLLVEVKDTGIGIAKDKIPLLFDQFSQADTSISREFGGTGLGLAITKGLVELFEGSIELDSQIGKGTTTRIQLPVQLAEAPLLTQDSSSTQSQSHVMIIDDNKINLKVAGKILTKLGYSVETHLSGQGGIEALQSRHFDLVLMDLQMPKMNGYESTLEIRRNHDATQLPILALSAENKEDVWDRIQEVGMQDFIQKPIDKEILSKSIQTYLA